MSLPAQSASGHHLGENEFWLNEDNYARNFLLASLWTINMSDEGEWGGSEKYGYKIRVLRNITIFFLNKGSLYCQALVLKPLSPQTRKTQKSPDP